MVRRVLLVLLVACLGSPRAIAADIEPTFRHEPLKKLLADLQDKDVTVRRQAATTLGMPDGSEGKGGPRPSGELWPAMLGLVEALQDKDMLVRGNSLRSLGLLMRYRGIPEKTDPRAEKIALAVIASLKDPEDLVRSAAAAALSTIGIETKDGVKSLTETMKHEEAKVRAAAADGAKGVRPIARIVPALAESLRDREAIVRLASANTLGFARQEGAAALKPLVELLKDEDAKVGAAAATALGSFGPQGGPAISALADVVTNPKSAIRNAAVGAIGMIHLDSDIAVPTLIGALAIEETRPSACTALYAFGAQGKAATPALIAFGRDEKGSVRPDVLAALSAIEPDGPAFFELLFAGLHDPNPFIRGVALNYFGRDQGYAEALPVLVVLFKVDGNLRNRVAYAFGAMGAEAKPVVPMLLEMIGDVETNPTLRRVLINTVNAIDPEVLKPPQ